MSNAKITFLLLAAGAVLVGLVGCGQERTSTLTISVTGNGTTTPSAGSHIYTITIGSLYPGKIEQSVTAIPDGGYVFDSWGGYLSGSDNPTTLTLEPERVYNITANFVPGFLLVTDHTGEGSCLFSRPPQNGGLFGANSFVTLTPVPRPGWRFDHWEGDLDGNSNPAQIQMTADMNVTAIFVQSGGEGEEEGEAEGEISIDVGEMISVPEGTFSMGNCNLGDDMGGYPEEKPAHDVQLGAYEIGKYHITNEQYASALNWALAQGYVADPGSDTYAYGAGKALMYLGSDLAQIEFADGKFSVIAREGANAVSYPMDSHPVVNVTWYGAALFCNWLSESKGLTACYDTNTWSCNPAAGGYHLPTEAQWERAAAWDGAKHWVYGFHSDTNTGEDRCNDYSDQDVEVNPLGLVEAPRTSPVGWFNGINISPNGNIQTVDGPSPVGCYDMSGNAWQWCNDWYDPNYYSGGAMTDPMGPALGDFRVARGGSWFNFHYLCRTAYRNKSDPASSSYVVGFRIAR